MKNQITDITPLKNLVNLRELTLDSNEITDLGPIKNLNKLEVLDLCYNPITKNLNIIDGLTKLETLWLVKTEINKLPNAEDLKNLEDLYIDENYLEYISKIENMQAESNLTATKNYIERKIKKEGQQIIQLPQIIRDAKNKNSKLYTEEDYLLEGCVLSEDGKAIMVDTEKVDSAYIMVQGGVADETKMEVKIEKSSDLPEQNISKNEEKPQIVKKDATVIPNVIPYAGIDKKIIIVLVINLIVIVFIYFKYRKYKNIK